MSKEDVTTLDNGKDCREHSLCFAPDGEGVCSKCGVVLSDDCVAQGPSVIEMSPALQGASQKLKVSLFISHKLGGKELNDLPGLSTARSLDIAKRDGGMRKRKGAQAYLSRFSNACSKLGLTLAESEHSWQLFARLYGELKDSDRRIINASEIACYAIAAGVAATTRQIRGERSVATAVMFAFHSKSVRDLYCIRMIVETHAEAVTGITQPALLQSSRWIKGRY